MSFFCHVVTCAAVLDVEEQLTSVLCAGLELHESWLCIFNQFFLPTYRYVPLLVNIFLMNVIH